MEKIKPEVVGYKTVYPSGGIGVLAFHRDQLHYVAMRIFVSSGIKPKFRPVYKTT